MAKAKTIAGYGKGWHLQSKRHSNARKFGKAGGKYATQFGILTPQGKITKSMSINLSEVKSPDPLAYSYGFFQGKTGIPISKDKDLDPEYLKGYKEGAKQKDSDGDGVPDKKDCEPHNPKKQDYAKSGFKTFPIDKEYEVEAYWQRTRNGFRHVAILKKNGVEVDKATANYLNRTWERYEYESVLKNLLADNPNLTQAQKDKFFGKTEQKDKEELDKRFGAISMVAKMGDIFGKTPKERVDWKKRMLKAGLPELDIPEDWETLSDKEKESRLDKVIEFMQKKR